MFHLTVAAAEFDPYAAKEAIRARAKALGFDAIGFASARPATATYERLSAFLEKKYNGDMTWMADRVEERADPRVLWPDVATAIVLGINYTPFDDPFRLRGSLDRGAVSVYARGRDYHDIVKGRLKTLAQGIAKAGGGIKVFVDTAPMMEKPLAATAGLGWQGKHTNLVSRRFGSWLFLGEILTTLELPPDDTEADRCGSCRRCLDVCPTKAMPAPYQLDARRCLSYLTIESKGPIPEDLRPAIGNRIYGCDDCLAVCPWNRFARASSEAAFLPRAELLAPRLADLAQLDDAGFRQVFSGSPIKRIGRDRFIRNVAVALGNCGDARVKPVVDKLRRDSSPLVADAAAWAAQRLINPSFLPADERWRRRP